MEPLNKQEPQATIFNPVSYVLQFLATYGWWVVAAAGAALARWRQAREDAEYHKDPDKVLARLEAVQRARERQQQELQARSDLALEQLQQREEKKRQETLERLQKYGAGKDAGQRLGGADDEYLPLSGGASTSSYRPPKRSACKGGGCGR